MSELSSELKEFVAKERGESASFLSESMNLQSDLSLWGDDAIEFFEAYKMKFQVDLSEFVISKYFKPEGDIILPTIIRFITGKKKLNTCL